jgi:hypothetical protein
MSRGLPAVQTHQVNRLLYSVLILCQLPAQDFIEPHAARLLNAVLWSLAKAPGFCFKQQVLLALIIVFTCTWHWLYMLWSISVCLEGDTVFLQE